jgi:hypothetical protein
MLRRLALAPVLVIAVIPLATFPTTGTQDVQAQEDDPLTIVETFFEEVNAGDAAGASALLADDFVFTDIDGGSFAAVGKPAFTSILEETNADIELLESEDDAGTVTGVISFSDEESDAAGVDRYLQPFTIVVVDGLMTRGDFTYDLDDDQTVTYLEYVTSQEPDDEGFPAGTLTVPLAAQPGGNQPGEAFIFEDAGMTFVGLSITPGPAGVQQLAHFHTGTCAAPGPIVEPLANVLDGESFTILSAAMSTLVDTGLIINVHKSVAEPTIYVSCGLVSSAPAPAPTATTSAPPPPAPTATAGSGGVTAPDTGSGPPSDGSPAPYLLLLVAGAIASTAGALTLARLRR